MHNQESSVEYSMTASLMILKLLFKKKQPKLKKISYQMKYSINRSSLSKWMEANASPCISPGLLSSSMASRDSKADIGLQDTEAPSGFKLAPDSPPKKKLTP